MVDIIDVATGQLVQRHDAQGNHGWGGASVQMNIAAMVVSEPQGVHVMDIKSGKLLYKFILPNGYNARVALSKDTITLGVASSTGVSWF